MEDVLLEQNRTESRVESANALILRDLAEASQQSTREGGFRDETDPRGF